MDGQCAIIAPCTVSEHGPSSLVARSGGRAKGMCPGCLALGDRPAGANNEHWQVRERMSQTTRWSSTALQKGITVDCLGRLGCRANSLIPLVTAGNRRGQRRGVATARTVLSKRRQAHCQFSGCNSRSRPRRLVQQAKGFTVNCQDGLGRSAILTQRTQGETTGDDVPADLFRSPF